MSELGGKEVDGAREVAHERVDPFTKIRFHPHHGLTALAPIRLGVLKEITGADSDVMDAPRGER